MSLHSFETVQREFPMKPKTGPEAVADGIVTKPAAWSASVGTGRSALSALNALKSRKWLMTGAAIAVVLAIGVGYWATRPAEVKPVGASNSDLTVTGVPVVVSSITHQLAINGSLRAFDELPLGTETVGIAIKEVLVDQGDHVKAGQLLARFNDDLLKADVAQKEALLIEAQANATEGMTNARRAEELLKTGAISQRDADSRRALGASVTARVGVAKANLEQSKARLRQAEIRSPADGIITYRGARVGAVMSGGGAELFRIQRDGRLELAAEVVERDLAEVKAGQSVEITVDTPAGPRKVQGAVRLVSPVVDPKTRIGIVRVDVPATADLRAGMFVSGHIALGEVSTLSVPEPAVVYQSAKSLVFVVDADQRVHARQVIVGDRQNGMVGVTGPISAGETVVRAGAGYLKEGDKVVLADKIPDADIKPLPQLK